MSHPYYEKAPLWIHWFSIFMWWPLPLIYIKYKNVDLSNFVLWKLVELVILLQFIVVPMTYEQMVDKICDVDYLLSKSIISDNVCSKIPSKYFSELNCGNLYQSILTTISGFLSGLSIYFAYAMKNDVKSKYHYMFTGLQIFSLFYWLIFFHVLSDDEGPCYTATAAANVARVTCVFTFFIVVFLLKSLISEDGDGVMDRVSSRTRSIGSIIELRSNSVNSE
jgi:hypothetical protein